MFVFSNFSVEFEFMNVSFASFGDLTAWDAWSTFTKY